MYKLYWCRQTAALAPELILEESGLPYEKVLVDTAKLEHRRLDYLAVNPAGLVPALALPGGAVLTETAAIVLWLCDEHRLELAPPPGDPARAVFLRWLFQLSNVVQTTYKRFNFPQRFSMAAEAAADDIKARALAQLDEHWKQLDDQFATAGPWVLGDRVSAVDLYLAMLVTWYPDTRALLGRHPALRRCFLAVLERPVAGRILRAHGEVPV